MGHSSFSSNRDLHDESKYLIRNTGGFCGRCCLNRPHFSLRVPFKGIHPDENETLWQWGKIINGSA